MCWAFFIGCAAAIFHYLLILLFSVHGWKPPAVGDWATWFGALGAFSAFGGAIWLATEANRQKRRDLHAAARLTAAGMYFQQIHNEQHTTAAANAIFLAINSEWRLTAGPGYLHNFVNTAVSRLQKVSPWTVGELVPLVPLRADCAVRLAAAQGRVQSTLKLLIDMKVETEVNLILGLLAGHYPILSNAAHQMKVAADIFGETVDQGATE